MFDRKDVVKGVCVKLKSAEEIRNWKGHGMIPCDEYGGKNVIVAEANDFDFRVSREVGIGRFWTFPYSLIDSIVSDENEIMECKKKAGYREIVCRVCGKKEFLKFYGHTNDYLCDDCAKTHEICPKCHKPILKTEMVAFRATTYSTRRICKECFEKALDSKEIVKDADDGGFYNRTICVEDENGFHSYIRYSGINSYHDMKNAGEYTFFKTEESIDSRSPLYLGVELEVENGDTDDEDDLEVDAKRIKAIFKNGFVEHEEDGSLDNGFENITMPATLAYHRSIADKYEQMFKLLIDGKYTSHNNGDCGLHIHFNRNFFGTKEEERTSKLLYLMEKFWSEMVVFSRRSESQLNRWARRYDESHEVVSKHYKDGHYGRYHAINLTNSKTIEFRLFRGTLNLDSYFATLEIVDRLVRLAKGVDIADLKKMTWDDVLNTETLKNYYNRVKGRRQRN